MWNRVTEYRVEMAVKGELPWIAPFEVLKSGEPTLENLVSFVTGFEEGRGVEIQEAQLVNRAGEVLEIVARTVGA